MEASARGQRYSSATGIDILALRFPYTAHEIPVRGGGKNRSPLEPIRLEVDPALKIPTAGMDLIIGEVKHGRAELNPRLRDSSVLETALSRTRCCPPLHVHETIQQLQRKGRVELDPITGRSCSTTRCGRRGVSSGCSFGAFCSY